MNISNLINDIQAVSRSLQENAVRAINQHVTARNWLIGYRIFHYEQHGEDRATYERKSWKPWLKDLKAKDSHIGI